MSRDDVPVMFRDGTPAPYSAAVQYSNSLPPVKAKHVAGCYKCHPAGCKCCCPQCCCTYRVACGDDCVWWGATFVCGIPLPWSCFICTCEREGNGWVMRNKHGAKTGEVLLVDEERGTVACYRTLCCSKEMIEEPDCYFTRGPC